MKITRVLLLFATAVLVAVLPSLIGASSASGAPQPYPTAPTKAVHSSFGVDATVVAPPPPANNNAQNNGGQLSETGVTVLGFSVLGVALLVGGGVLLFGGRNRRAHS